MKNAIQEYYNAKTLIIKSFRRMNYRIKEVRLKGLARLRFQGQKNILIRELRVMDKILGNILKGLK